MIDHLMEEAQIDGILSSPIAFKNRLRIEDRAYSVLRRKELLQDFLLAGGGAAAGAGVAGSATVAGTFFAPTGIMAWLGLATATTPVGWVLAAAVMTGGAFYAVGKVAGDKSAMVDLVPKHINTPLDSLAASLLELVGGLAFTVALADGELVESERRAIFDVLHKDWGYDPAYLEVALPFLASWASSVDHGQIADRLAVFLKQNPDCETKPMQDDLIRMVEEIIAADGVIRESERDALTRIAAAFEESGRFRLKVAKPALTQSP